MLRRQPQPHATSNNEGLGLEVGLGREYQRTEVTAMNVNSLAQELADCGLSAYGRDLYEDGEPPWAVEFVPADRETGVLSRAQSPWGVEGCQCCCCTGECRDYGDYDAKLDDDHEEAVADTIPPTSRTPYAPFWIDGN